MNRTELREKLNKIDCENCNQYDLVNLFESVKLSNEDLNKLSEMVEDKDIHDFLYERCYIVEDGEEKEEKHLSDFLDSGDFHTVLVDDARTFDIHQWEKDMAEEDEFDDTIEEDVADTDEHFIVTEEDVQKVLDKIASSNLFVANYYKNNAFMKGKGLTEEDVKAIVKKLDIGDYSHSVKSTKFSPGDVLTVFITDKDFSVNGKDLHGLVLYIKIDTDYGDPVAIISIHNQYKNSRNEPSKNPYRQKVEKLLEEENTAKIEIRKEYSWYNVYLNNTMILKHISKEDVDDIIAVLEKNNHPYIYKETESSRWADERRKAKETVEESMSSAVERQTLGYKKAKGQIQCNGGAQAKEVEDLLRAKYDNVTTQKGKGGKVIIKFSKDEGLTEETNTTGISADDIRCTFSDKGCTVYYKGKVVYSTGDSYTHGLDYWRDEARSVKRDILSGNADEYIMKRVQKIDSNNESLDEAYIFLEIGAMDQDRILDDIRTDTDWFTNEYNCDFDLRDHSMTIYGNRYDLKRLINDYYLEDYGAVIDESLSESNSSTIDEIISQFKSSVSDGLFDEETIGSMVDDMKKAKSSYDAFDIGNIYTNLNFFRFKDNDEIVRSSKRMGDKDVYFDRELAKPYIEKHQKNESLSEDTVKQGSQWVNKGKEGTHGKFKTKKEADAQRKAMFARGFKEGVEEEKTVIYKDGGVYNTTPESNYNSRIQNARKIHKVDWAKSAEDIIDYYIKNGWAKSADEFRIVEGVEDATNKIDPNTLPDDYVLINPGIRNYTDEDIEFYYECIKELVYPEEIEYEDLEVNFITNQRDADDWDEETYKIDWTYRPEEDDALDEIAEYLGEKFPGKITVGDIKKSAKDIQKYLYDHYYEDAVEDAKSKNSPADFREQLKEDKAKDTMKSVVAKWRSRRSNK